MLYIVEAWKLEADRNVSRKLQDQKNLDAWRAVAIAYPKNVADCVAVAVMEGYTRRQVGGSAEERFWNRVQAHEAARRPQWWGCKPEESSLDLPEGKSSAAPLGNTTMVAKLMLRVRGTDRVACWFRAEQPAAVKEAESNQEESVGETLIREA